MAMITICGTISAGKSALTEIVANAFGGMAIYEELPELLGKFYENGRETDNNERVAFLTQLMFMRQRMESIRVCRTEGLTQFNVLDRSLAEDGLFCRLAYEDNLLTDIEYRVYLDLQETMWRELEMIPSVHPDLSIYIRISYETFEKRLLKRGRDMEIENYEKNKDYFYRLWSRYDDFINGEYLEKSKCPLLIIDGDSFDFVENDAHRTHVLGLIATKLNEIGVKL